EVIAFLVVPLLQLIARKTLGRCVAVGLAVDTGNTETPIDVVLLNRVGQALDDNHVLVVPERVWLISISGWVVAVLAAIGGADVAAGIDPAVNLDVVAVEPLPNRGRLERSHQGAVDGIRHRGTDVICAAHRPFGEGEWRLTFWRRRPWRRPARHGVRI